MPTRPDRPSMPVKDLGYPITEGHISTSEVLEDYQTLHAPLREVITQYPGAVRIPPETLDRIFASDIPDQIADLEQWVAAAVTEGIRNRLNKISDRWQRLQESVQQQKLTMASLYMDIDTELAEYHAEEKDQETISLTPDEEEYVRLNAWALKLQNRIAEVRTTLGFISGKRLW